MSTLATTLSAVALAAYLLPTIAAVLRRHGAWPAIAVVNVALGWTLIGWVVALSWAASDAGNARCRRGRPCPADATRSAAADPVCAVCLTMRDPGGSGPRS